MTTQDSMTVEASLSGSAAKLLLHLLRRGRVWGSMAEMMAGAGISKPSYLAARRELLDKELDLRGFGFLPAPVKELDHGVKYFGPGGQETLPQVKEVAPEGSSLFTPMQTVLDSSDTLSDADLLRGVQVLSQRQPLDGVRVPTEERNFSEDFEKSALALCQEADRLPADGDPLRPTSEFQARRGAQVKAVCTTWGKLFPEQNPLTTQRAKELLVAASNVAEDVYDALQSAAGKEYPFGYARKILLNKPKPKPGEEDHSQEYLVWTPEMEAKQQKAIEKLKRVKGFNKSWLGEETEE